MDSENTSLTLTLVKIYTYLDAQPTSRCINEGEALLHAKHVITCGIMHQDGDHLEVFALCLQTSALSDKPHEINCEFITKEERMEIKSASCSRKAGNSCRCKHISAVLLLCNRCDNVLDMDKISSTDVSCYWKKANSQALYAPIPVEKFLCIKGTEKIKDISDETEIQNMLQELALALPNSAVALQLKGRRKVAIAQPVEVTTGSNEIIEIIIENCRNSISILELQDDKDIRDCCQLQFDKLAGDVTQIAISTCDNRGLWNMERQYRITGSRCYSIYTYSQNNWAQKAQKYFWPKSFSNRYVQHGIEYEPIARDLYIQKFGCEVQETGLIVCASQPWLAYSPDGIVFMNGKPIKLLEIKCPYIGNFLYKYSQFETSYDVVR